MKKHTVLAFFLQFFFAPSSKAVYTLQKLPSAPNKLTHIYKIVYELKNHAEYLKEEGILTEKITLLDPVCHDEPAYQLEYQYEQYKEKNNYNVPIHHFQSQLSLGKNFNILKSENYHPIIFYLYNIRSGLQTEFAHKGATWFATLEDNKVTYSSNFYSTFPMHVQYTVQNIIENSYFSEDTYKIVHSKIKHSSDEIQDIDDFIIIPASNDQSVIASDRYIINWNALSICCTYSRRYGEINIDSNGVLKYLNINLPQQLKGFEVNDLQKRDQPITLKIERINKDTYTHIKSTFCFPTFQIN